MTLREFIQTNGLTQPEMALRLNVSSRTLAKWVYGESIPRRDAMQRIIDVTDGAVTPADFYKTAA